MPEEKSSEQWLKELNEGLNKRYEAVKKYRDYYHGKQEQSYSTERFQKRFGTLFSALNANFCKLVVDSREERLNVKGFRLGGRETEDADDEAWRIWQANRLDSDGQILHRVVHTVGDGYVSVWANPDEPRTPIISIEDPAQVVLYTAAGNRRKKLAALKRWKDDSGYVFCTLYLPHRIEKYRSEAKNPSGFRGPWKERQDEQDEGWPVRNPYGEVPIFRFVNQPWIDGTGCSDLAPVIPLQDAINKELGDMVLASEFAAFPQRWATGVEIPTDDNGNPIEPPESAVARLWMTEDDKARYGQFEAADLGNYVKAIETLIQQIASITKTPAHYLLGQSGNFPSGESMKATETGLVAVVKDAQTHLGESWRDVIRFGFRVQGDETRANVTDAEILWADPESRTESEHVDAVMKMVAMGLPFEYALDELGFSPQKKKRILRAKARESLLADNVVSIQDRAAQRLAEQRQGAGIAGSNEPRPAGALPLAPLFAGR